MGLMHDGTVICDPYGSLWMLSLFAKLQGSVTITIEAQETPDVHLIVLILADPEGCAYSTVTIGDKVKHSVSKTSKRARYEGINIGFGGVRQGSASDEKPTPDGRYRS